MSLPSITSLNTTHVLLSVWKSTLVCSSSFDPRINRLFVFYIYGEHQDLHVLTHSVPPLRSPDRDLPAPAAPRAPPPQLPARAANGTPPPRRTASRAGDRRRASAIPRPAAPRAANHSGRRPPPTGQIGRAHV